MSSPKIPSKNRRRRFLIDRPLQLRYMLYVSFPLLIVCGISFFALYLGIWADVLSSFTNAQIQQDLVTATRMAQYEEVREDRPSNQALSVFRSAEHLSDRQREIFKNILDHASRNIVIKILLLLIFIAWGTIYISHKIAGPIFHLLKIGKEVEGGNYRARVFLRKGDEIHPLADQMNATYQSVDSRIGLIKKWVRTKPPAEAVALIQKELGSTQAHEPA